MAISTPDPVPGSSPPALPDMEGAAAEEILAWAVREYFPSIAVASSMQDAVVVDLAWKVEPRIEVFFLETGFHFDETLEVAAKMRERYGLNLVSLTPGPDPAVYDREGYEACCAARKVGPMEAYLKDKAAWVSGVRRADSPARSGVRAVEWDAKRAMAKINPIAGWSDEDVARYVADNDLIVNPLRYKGYDSIGCWPCTQPGRGREGRWSGSGKDECGIHVAEPGLSSPLLQVSARDAEPGG